MELGFHRQPASSGAAGAAAQRAAGRKGWRRSAKAGGVDDDRDLGRHLLEAVFEPQSQRLQPVERAIANAASSES